ncbi:MAPEG family protein [Alkalimonas sp. NCh-2]|uniref:MAPEG family protein n=1 Tax=Alkalimonas sp. NCh-2 TaxID=3144846 RepID=UPI0031F652C6
MDKWLLLTVFGQVLLTSVVLILMGRRRFAAARRGELSMDAFALMQLDKANAQVIATGRNFDNQFQMPMLYLFAVVFILQQGLADASFVLMGAFYLLLRVFHALIHTGSNRLRWRFRTFVYSCAVLWVIWLRLLWLLFFG